MKFCKKCNQNKEKDNFGKDKQKTDGLNQYCKKCIKDRSAEQKIKNPEYYEKYARLYREKNREKLRNESNKRFRLNKEKYLEKGRQSYHLHKEEIAKKRKIKRELPGALEKERERQKKYRLKDPKKYRLYVKKWQQTNKEKHCAHQRVNRAVRNGILKRDKNCKECGKICRTEAHHEDYLKPLDVIWLCRKCHGSKIATVEV